MNRKDSDSSVAALHEGRAILAKVRRAGFIIGLDSNDHPKIAPLNLLSPAQKELLRQHRQSIRLALLVERKPASLLTPFDRPSWDDLAAWWLTWTPPQEPYDLDSAVHVSDAKRSYEYHADLLRSGCSGQVQLALFDWLKRHAVKFGGPVA